MLYTHMYVYIDILSYFEFAISQERLALVFAQFGTSRCGHIEMVWIRSLSCRGNKTHEKLVFFSNR